MQKFIWVLTMVCLFNLAAVGCKSKEQPSMDIEVGMTRNEVIEILGEPQDSLSGFYGDVYIIDDCEVIIYYDVRRNSDAVVSEVKVFPAREAQKK